MKYKVSCNQSKTKSLFNNQTLILFPDGFKNWNQNQKVAE